MFTEDDLMLLEEFSEMIDEEEASEYEDRDDYLSDFLDDVYRKLRMEYQMEDEPKCEIIKAFRKYGY